ncbi:alpha-lytic protease prodomain-containing protein [Polymorphospora rubra]|uniref:Serine protease n=1 Tax=Polymorphospora rubra TaxID=338584 RepID=A0A810N9M0_9ACTN|nr:alpha-lytic protease prodomain-containing protein [Polymorphospora rubra]BCJ70352.1 hypothetical protein Prubr_73730 [Polymorphospora rubra]
MAALVAAVLLPGWAATGPGVALAAPDTAPTAGTERGPDAGPATAQLTAALQRDLRLSADQVRIRLEREAAAPAVERRLRGELGTRFGGAWLSTDGQLTVGVTGGSATMTTDAVARTAAKVRAAGANPQPVSRSEAQLNEVKATLDHSRATAPPTVTGWYVDLPGNTVVVRSLPGHLPAAQRFAAAAGVAAEVRVLASTEQPRPLYALQGGDKYSIGTSFCSIGFSVQEVGFVTAGHCAAPGALTGWNGAALGTWGGSSFPGDDHAWVQANDDWAPTADVAGVGPVDGSEEAVVGASVCRSGHTTKARCGIIQAKDETVNYPQGTVTGMTRTNACAQPGDSGGPFISGTQAQGVTSGGSGNCTVGGTTYFQPVNEILTTYGLTLTTRWNGWSAVPGNVVTHSAPATTTYFDSQYLFARATDDSIKVSRFTGTAWSGWSDVAPGTMRTASAPAATVYNGSLHLFARGDEDYELWLNRLTGTVWSGWTAVPSAVTYSAPAVTVNNGSLYLFIRRTDDSVAVNRLTGTTWSGWTAVPGSGVTSSALGATVHNGSLHLFARGRSDNAIYLNRLTGTAWSGWSAVPGMTATTSAPAATAVGNTLYLVIRGLDNSIVLNRLTGTTWTGWSVLPGNGETPDGLAANAVGGRLELFARGTENRIWSYRTTP